MGENNYTEGGEFLAFSWFLALEELNEIILSSDSAENRIQAADVVLNYCARMNQGLGDPWIPWERPDIVEEDKEDE